MRRVVVAGTFDGLHAGHRDFFRQARQHSDFLIVIVARDGNVEKMKKRPPQRTEEQRLQAVRSEPLVDTALLGMTDGEKFLILTELRPAVVFLGYDQPANEHDLRVFLDTHGLKHVLVRRGTAFRPDVYKSSLLSTAPTSVA